MSQFKNARMCSLHFNADGEETSTTLPSRNIPDFERQEAAAGLVQLAVSHMESNQRNVYGDQINPDNSTEDLGNILEATEGPNPITEPQTIANHDTNIEDTANILEAADFLIPITKPQTIAHDDVVIITQPSLITPGRAPSQIIKRKLFSDSASQVTPKRKTTSKGIQRTPGKQKHTQVTPKQKRSEKSSTDISISTETPTKTPSSFYIKYTKTTQTDSKITCDKSSQVNISKIENLKSSDKELKRYTGIEDYKLFTIRHKYLVSCCSHTECEIIPGHGDPNKLILT